MKHRPSIVLVKGGQGRSGDEVSTAAWIVFWAGMAVLAIAGIGKLIQEVM